MFPSWNPDICLSLSQGTALFSLIHRAASTSSSSVDCASRGFNPNEVLCSYCEDLVQFQLKQLASECRACCKDDGSKLQEAVKYPKAVLEVCG